MNNEFNEFGGMPYGLYLRLGRQANLQEQQAEKAQLKAAEIKETEGENKEEPQDELQEQAQKPATLSPAVPIDTKLILGCY
jgi:hypothetical protein